MFFTNWTEEGGKLHTVLEKSLEYSRKYVCVVVLYRPSTGHETGWRTFGGLYCSIGADMLTCSL